MDGLIKFVSKNRTFLMFMTPQLSQNQNIAQKFGMNAMFMKVVDISTFAFFAMFDMQYLLNENMGSNRFYQEMCSCGFQLSNFLSVPNHAVQALN